MTMTAGDSVHTTASGAPRVAMLLLMMLPGSTIQLQTSSALQTPSHVRRGGGATSAGFSEAALAAPSETDADLLASLRSTAGLSWHQVASLFGVSRRSVHAWAAGATMRTTNRERLIALSDLAHRTSGGTAERRAALFSNVGVGSPLLRPEALLERGAWVDVPHVLDDEVVQLG